jgi:hypothetical protein
MREFPRLDGVFPNEAEVVTRSWDDIAPPCRVALGELREGISEIYGSILEHVGFEVVRYAGFYHLWEDMPALQPHVVITHNHLRNRQTYEPLHFASALRARRFTSASRYPLWGATYESIHNPKHPLGNVDAVKLLLESFDFVLPVPTETKTIIRVVVDQIARVHPMYVPQDALRLLR